MQLQTASVTYVRSKLDAGPVSEGKQLLRGNWANAMVLLRFGVSELS